MKKTLQIKSNIRNRQSKCFLDNVYPRIRLCWHHKFDFQLLKILLCSWISSTAGSVMWEGAGISHLSSWQKTNTSEHSVTTRRQLVTRIHILYRSSSASARVDTWADYDTRRHRHLNGPHLLQRSKTPKQKETQNDYKHHSLNRKVNWMCEALGSCLLCL